MSTEYAESYRLFELKTDSLFTIEVSQRLAQRGILPVKSDLNYYWSRTLALVSHQISMAADGRTDPEWARDGSVSEEDLDYLVGAALDALGWEPEPEPETKPKRKRKNRKAKAKGRKRGKKARV